MEKVFFISIMGPGALCLQAIGVLPILERIDFRIGGGEMAAFWSMVVGTALWMIIAVVMMWASGHIIITIV